MIIDAVSVLAIIGAALLVGALLMTAFHIIRGSDADDTGLLGISSGMAILSLAPITIAIILVLQSQD